MPATSFSILGDTPVEKSRDSLNFGEFVEPFARRLIESVGNTPFTVGIFAPWGQGKSTVMRMLQAQLEGRGCPTIWFEPWKYNGREGVWKGLALTLVGQVRRNETLRAELMRRQAPLKAFAAKALWGSLIGRDWAQDLVDAVQKEPWSPSLLHEVEEHLETLFELVNRPADDGAPRPLVLFVDDLDRCLPDTALAVLEAVKLVLSRRGLIIVMGIAVEELARAVQAAYAKEMKDTPGPFDKDWGHKYLAKMIQLPFELPFISAASFEDYVGRCLDESHISEVLVDERWKRIIREACRSNLREVKRFVNHFISEMDKAIANQGQAPNQPQLDPRRVAFLVLLGWQFAPFLLHVRNTVSESDLLIRYQLYFGQRLSAAGNESSLRDAYRLAEPAHLDDDALAALFNRLFVIGGPPLVPPFSAGHEIEPYLQFGMRTVDAGQPEATGERATPPAVPVVPESTSPSPAAVTPPVASRPVQDLAVRARELLASAALTPRPLKSARECPSR
jgi:hypothetical protein